MPENQTNTSVIEKICHESECAEKIATLSSDEHNLFKTFTYCPYCAEELSLVCQACKEELNNNEYKFCPWCGAKFQEDAPNK
ncbi:MAG: hypothetical protein LBT38_11045 [Deltaproteobacteria bacterium]|nr:hypothetical protein [Deltaproteobacteria bacterium]